MQHRCALRLGGRDHLFQPGIPPGGREDHEEVFRGQRLRKSQRLFVDGAGDAPLAQMAEPDGCIQCHRKASALRRHLDDLAAAQQREHPPQLPGVDGLNGGPQLLFPVGQNVQQGLTQLVLPFLPGAPGGLLLLHGIPRQRQLEFAVVLEAQLMAQPGDGGLGRTAHTGQLGRRTHGRPLYICKNAVRDTPLGAVKLDAGTEQSYYASGGFAHK